MNIQPPTAQQRLWSLIVLCGVLIACLVMLVIIAITKDGQAVDVVVNTLQATINSMLIGIPVLAGVQLLVNGAVQTITAHAQAQVAQTVATANAANATPPVPSDPPADPVSGA